jgi:hypothetical protein
MAATSNTLVFAISEIWLSVSMRWRYSMRWQWRLSSLHFLIAIWHLISCRVPLRRSSATKNRQTDIMGTDIGSRCRRTEAGGMVSHLQNLWIDILSHTSGTQAHSTGFSSLHRFHSSVGYSLTTLQHACILATFRRGQRNRCSSSPHSERLRINARISIWGIFFARPSVT